MLLARRIWNWCKRFRHRCGYGVHSPSDFFLITSVIYEKLPYYAYEELKKSNSSRRLLRYREKEGTIFVDHPYQCGLVAFLKK